MKVLFIVWLIMLKDNYTALIQYQLFCDHLSYDNMDMSQVAHQWDVALQYRRHLEQNHIQIYYQQLSNHFYQKHFLFCYIYNICLTLCIKVLAKIQTNSVLKDPNWHKVCLYFLKVQLLEHNWTFLSHA